MKKFQELERKLIKTTFSKYYLFFSLIFIKKMNKLLIFLCIITLLLTFHILLSTSTMEGYRGRGRRRRGGRRGPRAHLYRHRRRHYYPRRWYHRFYDWSPWFVYDTSCKDGCTSLGNGRWGCQYPGTGPNDCVFAEDCAWCGSYSRPWYYF